MLTAPYSPVSSEPSATGKIRLVDLLGVVLLSIAVGLLFLKEPGQGDDFTYWSTAWDIHLRGGDGWSPNRFHHLRWPVWGLNWVLQGLAGPGLFSFYAVPFFYLSLGSVVAFFFGARLFNARAAGWATVIAFVYNTLLDTVIFRPMPDMGEGTMIGAAVLCWLGIVNSDRTSIRLLLTLTTGLLAGLLFSNRITGVFVFGVLAAVALITCWRNPRFTWKQTILWLGGIFLVWAAFVTTEAIIYHSITGDYLHALHANMGAKGRKGTDSVAIYTLPFRFLKNLQGQDALGMAYLILALVGGVQLWRQGGQIGRVVVAWSISLYLCYSCSIQSVSPVRPLLRDAGRFMASLALPLSILAIAGLWWLVCSIPKLRTISWLPLKVRAFFSSLPDFRAIAIRRPVAIALAAILLLSFASHRHFFSLGYTVEFSRYLDTVPAGTKVFTQRWMQLVAYLVNPKKAAQIKWKIKEKILEQTDQLEKLASESDQFWYCRKITWISTRKALEMADVALPSKEIGTYLSNPSKEWALNKVIIIGGLPDLIFYHKRPAGSAIPQAIDVHTFFPSLIPLPLKWTLKEGDTENHRFNSPEMPIPESLRGKNVRLEFIAAANTIQAANLQFHFSKNGKKLSQQEIRPYLYSEPELDFHALQIPADADSIHLEARTSKKAKWIKLDEVRIIVEEPTALAAAK